MKNVAVLLFCVTVGALGVSGCSRAPTPVSPEEVKKRESAHSEIVKQQQEINKNRRPGGAHTGK